MSFAASRSGCQASTKIGATPAHTGKVHTQVVSCLCFVSTERTRQASCCTSGRRELNFALTWIAFVFGSPTWLEKWQLSHGFAVDGAYCLGFSTFLSEKCNCHTVSLWGRAYSLGFGTLEAGILATVVLLRIGLSEKLFQCEFCTGTTCAPSEPAVAKHTDWL